MKKVIIFVKRFPVLSQTFVVEQVNSLIEQGFSVEIISLQREEQEFELESLVKHDLLSLTHYIEPRYKSRNSVFRKLFLITFIVLSYTCYRRFKSTAKLLISILKKKRTSLAFDIANVAWYNRNKHFEADAILTHFGNYGVIAQALKEGKIMSGKLHTIFHGYELSEYKSIELWKGHYVALADKSTLLPISNFWKDRLVKWGADSSAIKVHRMGVDVDNFEFQNNSLRSPVRIVSVARATEKKGLKYAILAMQYLGDNYHLDIIGGGHLQEQLQSLCKQLQLDSQISFHGAKPPDFVKQTLKNADVFLLPSITDSVGDMEGIPVALMEAMASGKIVVSTLHSGIPELIEDGKNGFLVPERDEQAIADAISRISSSKSLPSIRAAARKTVEENYNNKILIEALAEEIESQP